jgi:hypothetical protein
MPLAWASVSIGALLLRNMEGRSFHRAFKINRYIKRFVKMPCKQVSLSIGAPFGVLKGICLPRFFGEKMMVYLGSFLDPEDIKVLSLGAIWIFGKGTGLS